jgi:uracil-DNA glycosylase family 4
MTSDLRLKKIAREIARCPVCRKGCTGKAVPGEGAPDARIVFVGEAPGREEAKTGRPFVGRSGQLLREAIRKVGLVEGDVFITSPVHYFPLSGTPSSGMIEHGKEHLFRQLDVIRPDIVVLLGATACRAVLGARVQVAKEHGRTVVRDRRTCFITLHPAYALRFPAAKETFSADFRKLRRLARKGSAATAVRKGAGHEL